MIEDDPADPSDERERWVTCILGTLLAFECTILVFSLIWLQSRTISKLPM